MKSHYWVWIGLFFGLAWVQQSKFPSPTFTLGGTGDYLGPGTDPVSHIGAAKLFFEKGFEVYAKSPRQLCDTPKSLGGHVLECGNTVLNWADLPRPYPLGTYLYVAPEALALSLGASLEAATRFSVLKQLLIAIIFLWVFWKKISESVLPPPVERGRVEGQLFTWLVFPLIAMEVLRFTLRGAYDAIYLIPILLCMEALWKDGKPAKAFFYWAVALFLGYRALWYIPLGVYAFYSAISTHSWRNKERGKKEIFYLTSGLFASVVSIFGFAILWIRFSEWPLTQQLRAHQWVIFLVPVTLVCAYLLKIKNRWLAGLMAAQVTVVIMTRQVQGWYLMCLYPFLYASCLTKEKMQTVLPFWIAVFVVMAAQAELIFQTPLFSGQIWLEVMSHVME